MSTYFRFETIFDAVNSSCSEHGETKYSGTSLLRSPMGLGKSDLNGEVTVLQGAKLHCGMQFGTAKR